MWKTTKYMSIFGAVLLLASMFLMDSAPQQAALASIAIGFAVIPYCIARANQEIIPKEEVKANNERS